MEASPTDNQGVKGQSIRIAVEDAALSRALMARVRQASNGNPVLDDGTLDALGPGDIVITTPADCSAVECHLMAERGVRVIVLAPVIRDFDRQRYMDAGAEAYLPMLVDTAELVGAVARALGEGVPMMPMRAVCRN